MFYNALIKLLVGVAAVNAVMLNLNSDDLTVDTTSVTSTSPTVHAQI
jgi:hypothetical protein